MVPKLKIKIKKAPCFDIFSDKQQSEIRFSKQIKSSVYKKNMPVSTERFKAFIK